MGGQRFYIGRESGDLLGVQSISKILNALKLDKESKKYVLSELKKYENKFPNVVASEKKGTLDIEDGKGVVDEGYYLKSTGLELMLREALVDMVKVHSVFIENVLPSTIKQKRININLEDIGKTSYLKDIQYLIDKVYQLMEV